MQIAGMHNEKWQPVKIFQIVLLCFGFLSSLVYLAMNIVTPLLYDGYNAASQTVSELSAIDAPTRPLWLLLAIFYSLLVIAFGYGIWKTADRKKLRVVGLLFIINGLIGFFWPPMHQREVIAAGGATLTDTLHIIFTIVTVLLMILSIAFASAVLGRSFAIYSMITLLTMVFFGVLAAIDGRKLEANLPTPWLGVWERINIGVYMLWVAVLSIVLLRNRKAVTGQHNRHTI